jgi:hypothetical protein
MVSKANGRAQHLAFSQTGFTAKERRNGLIDLYSSRLLTFYISKVNLSGRVGSEGTGDSILNP